MHSLLNFFFLFVCFQNRTLTFFHAVEQPRHPVPEVQPQRRVLTKKQQYRQDKKRKITSDLKHTHPHSLLLSGLLLCCCVRGCVPENPRTNYWSFPPPGGGILAPKKKRVRLCSMLQYTGKYLLIHKIMIQIISKLPFFRDSFSNVSCLSSSSASLRFAWIL